MRAMDRKSGTAGIGGLSPQLILATNVVAINFINLTWKCEDA